MRFLAVHAVFFFHETLFYTFVYLNVNFLYMLLYIETSCTILILQERYAHGTFATGRASMPTQEKKNVITTVKDVDN